MKKHLAALGLITAASSCGIAHAAPDWNRHHEIAVMGITTSPAKTRSGKVDWMASAGSSLAAVGADIKRYARQLTVPQDRSVFRGRNAKPASAPVSGAVRTAMPASASAASPEIPENSESPAGPASAIAIEKAEDRASQPAAALYVGNGCTASRSVCQQFAADVAKEKIAQVTSDANGVRAPAGLRVRFRYKF